MTEQKIAENYGEMLESTRKYIDFSDMLFHGEDLFKTVSLTNILVKALKGKKPNIKPYDVLVLAYGTPDTEILNSLFNKISILCELTDHKEAKFNNYGITSAKTMLETIKVCLQDWLPF